MRERIANAVCVLTLCVVTVLSLLFASRHNQAPGGADTTVRAPVAGPIPAPVHSTAPVPLINGRGRDVVRELGCLSCHSIGGAGNPRYPLDGVGARWNAAELRLWISGSGFAADRLSVSVARRKQRYQDMPEADQSALVLYLSGLNAAPK